jgi:putative hydrolase of the HAD superfamily
MIRAVLFDLDDTLFDYRGFMSGCENYLSGLIGQHLGIPPTRCLVALRQVKRNLYRSKPLDPAIFDWGERISRTTAFLGRTPELDLVRGIFLEFWNRFLSIIEPYPDAIGTLSMIHNLGLRSAVISNGIREQQTRKVEALGLSPLLDGEFYSEDVGRNKPARPVFQHALRGVGVDPAESLMVGDLCHVDVKGGRASGMLTCWLRIGAYSHLTPKNESEEPDYTIPRLTDLSAILSR